MFQPFKGRLWTDIGLEMLNIWWKAAMYLILWMGIATQKMKSPLITILYCVMICIKNQLAGLLIQIYHIFVQIISVRFVFK